MAVSRSVFSAIRVTTEGWVTAANVEWAMTYVPMGNNVSVRDNVLQLGCKVKVLMTLVPYCLWIFNGELISYSCLYFYLQL